MTIKIGLYVLNVGQIAYINPVELELNTTYKLKVVFSGGATFTHYDSEDGCDKQHERILKAMEHDSLDTTIVTDY